MTSNEYNIRFNIGDTDTIIPACKSENGFVDYVSVIFNIVQDWIYRGVAEGYDLFFKQLNLIDKHYISTWIVLSERYNH